MLNWNDLNSFITLSRSKKLINAARKLKIESTTIARRISRLEESLKTQLFHKSPRGYSLTDSGLRLLRYAEKVESQMYSISESFMGINPNIKGKVRISVGEGLGVEILTKYLNKFYEKYPEIEIELLADTRSRSLSNRETDILISLSRPKKGRLKSWKLCDYYVKLYGSNEYLKNNPKISDIKDLSNHKFVNYADELIEFPELNYLQEINSNPNVVFSSNSLRSQLLAVKNGIGIGLLHSFVAYKEKDLKVILPKKINIKREYWIVVHENNFHLRRIKAVTDFVTTILNDEKKFLSTIK